MAPHEEAQGLGAEEPGGPEGAEDAARRLAPAPGAAGLGRVARPVAVPKHPRDEPREPAASVGAPEIGLDRARPRPRTPPPQPPPGAPSGGSTASVTAPYHSAAARISASVSAEAMGVIASCSRRPEAKALSCSRR